MKSPIKLIDKNRFSKVVKSTKDPNYQSLVAWQNWFNSRGIPSVIGSTPRGGYALYREALIEFDIRDTRSVTPDGIIPLY